ncbi:MAG: hypothetical protein IKE41_03165 [Clostridia bacterium]|nr:hypothetical protein [Clostridia bacterium]
MISEQDLKLKLILGLPIEINKIKIHSVKVKDIAEFGYLKYNQALKIISADSFEIKKILNTDEDISPFEFVVISVMSSMEIRILIEDLFALIFKEKTEFSEEQLCFNVGKHELNKDNFNEIINVICKRNGATKSEKDLGKPSNEKARKILEKRNLARSKLNKSGENGFDLADLVSFLSIYFDTSTLLNLDIYQLTDRFTRIIKKENYDISVDSLIHGANKSDLDLKHWSEK